MAKQKKQKKVGLLKRKQNKLNKKRSLKKKLLARKKLAPKQPMMSKVKKNLRNLPSIVFEPELQEIQFSEEQIKQVQSQYEKLPEQIEAIATNEFQDKLKEQFILLKTRYENIGDMNRVMMVEAVQYFMEQKDAMSFMNQVIVGMYMVAANALDQPDSKLTLEQLNLKLKEYDKEWTHYFKERAQALESEEEEAETAAENEERIDSPFEPLMKEFTVYISEVLQLDEETIERTEEDIEVLLNDFCEEKAIVHLEELKPRKIKNFLEGWFIRNMHPTKEDLEIMIDSIKTLVEFLKTEGKLSPEFCEEISVHLQDRDAILAHIST